MNKNKCVDLAANRSKNGQYSAEPEASAKPLMHPYSQPNETTFDVRQGCTLTPTVLCIAIDGIFSWYINSMGTTVSKS